LCFPDTLKKQVEIRQWLCYTDCVTDVRKHRLGKIIS
jgi:hypothetical protein